MGFYDYKSKNIYGEVVSMEKYPKRSLRLGK